MIYEKMPFGKHAGEYISDIPSNYLIYAFEKFSIPDELSEAIQAELLDRLQLTHPDIIGARIIGVYKDLCKKYHPDVGGNVEAMKAINEFKTLLL